MHITVAQFSEPLILRSGDATGFMIRLDRGAVHVGADGEVRTLPNGIPAQAIDFKPFSLSELGANKRLAWEGGACTVKPRARVAVWSERYAAIVESRSLTVIDAQTGKQARLELPRGALPFDFNGSGIAAYERTLAIAGDRVVSVFPQPELEEMVASAERGITIEAQRIFPMANARGGVESIDVKIVRGKARDPIANSSPIVASDPRLEELVAQVARDSAGDASRLVLADLLQEMGESYGTWIAKPGAHRRESLGPLKLFLDDVEFRAGLPWRATMARRPPNDEALISAAVDDLRLGLLSSLRARKGHRSIYARLVGSPRAVGLRHVDASDKETLQALITGGRTELTHLYDVRFAKAPLVKLLADPTFDRAEYIETLVQTAYLGGLLDRLCADEHGFWKRARRRLAIRERFGHTLEILGPTLQRFTHLPIIEIDLGIVIVTKLANNGFAARIPSTAMPASYWLTPLAAALPDLATIEMPADSSTRDQDAVRIALPRTQIRRWPNA